jgi:iron(III) transport system substrate-binding protein
MRSRIFLVLVSVVAAVAALAGANPAATAPDATPPNPLTSVLRQIKGLKPAARQAKLLELAKAEGGTLEWYTSLSSLISKPVEEAFEKQYDLKVNRFRASSETVSARITSEADANRSGADIIETNGTDMIFFQNRRDVLVPYTSSPYRKGIPKAGRYATFTADRVEKYAVSWNTNALPAGGPPKSWEDLASARFKGKISMEPTDQDWFAALWTYLQKKKHWSNAKLNRVFSGIAKNSVITRGHTTMATLLAAGQFAVALSPHAQSIQQLEDDGAPLAFKPFVNPVIFRNQGVGIAYRLKHPAAALLFYDWLLTKSGGQRVLLENNAEPARKDVGESTFKGAKTVAMDLRSIVARFDFWTKRYDGFIRQAGK